MRGGSSWSSAHHVVLPGAPRRWLQPSRWERRLAASVIATLPHEDPAAAADPATIRRALAILADLIGDAEPDVQKALSWAFRSLARLDLAATVDVLRRESRVAAATDDGHRAWVIRDTLPRLPAPVAQELRAGLDGIRRRPGAPSTSRAAATAADFLSFGLAVPPAERPIIDRT